MVSKESSDGYVLVDPFEVDEGELDGHTPEEAFALGVEWASFRGRLAAEPGEFSETVHTANVPRLLRMAARRGRETKATWMINGLMTPGWCLVTVYPKKVLTLVV
jgi:hypothetical protein